MPEINTHKPERMRKTPLAAVLRRKTSTNACLQEQVGSVDPSMMLRTSHVPVKEVE